MKKRTLLKSLAAAACLAAGLGAGTAQSLAQEVTLRLHQFLVDLFGAMSLGGTPPQLIDQARDGVVDIV